MKNKSKTINGNDIQNCISSNKIQEIHEKTSTKWVTKQLTNIIQQLVINTATIASLIKQMKFDKLPFIQASLSGNPKADFQGRDSSRPWCRCGFAQIISHEC